MYPCFYLYFKPVNITGHLSKSAIADGTSIFKWRDDYDHDDEDDDNDDDDDDEYVDDNDNDDNDNENNNTTG